MSALPDPAGGTAPHRAAPRTLLQTIEGLTLWIVGLGLLLAGVGTGTLLWVDAGRSMDTALLSAAHARAGSGDATRWQVEHSWSPVQTRIVPPGDPDVPEALVRRAVDTERPVAYDDGANRVLLVCAETAPTLDPALQQASPGDEPGEVHLLIAASAPRPTLLHATGPFALAWLIVSVATLAALAAYTRRQLTLALRPLDAARLAAAGVPGFGSGQRLDVQGPAEVQDLLSTINALLDRLEAAWAGQVRFTSQAAHELRTPLAVLRMEVDLALRRPRSLEEARASLASIGEGVSRLEGLVEALLSLARLESDTLGHERVVVRASEIARDALAQETHELLARGNVVTLALLGDGQVRVQPRLAVAALANLLRNAARHAPGAPVRLELDRVGSDLVFTVRDGGSGFPETGREALFSPFVRGAPAVDGPSVAEDGPLAEAARGLGLGLAFAREVARRHGGECEILDGPGGVVRLRLPVF